MRTRISSFLSSINFFSCFVLEFFLALILIFVGVYSWWSPGGSQFYATETYQALNEVIEPYFMYEPNFGNVGLILLGTGAAILGILVFRLYKIKKNKIIYFTSPHAEVNVKQLEKNLEDSLSILSGIKKSNVKIQMKILSQTILCQANIIIEEGVHIPQIEKAIIHLLRKRIKEVLLGLPIQVKVMVNIKIEPEKNYVSYNVIQEYQDSLPPAGNDQTNFPRQSGIGVDNNN